MSRKESIKKSLGISEYPWSSDDDETESTPPNRESHTARQEHSLGNNQFQSEVAGTSGSSATASNGNSRRKNHLFWSLSLASPQRATSRNRIEMPRLSMVSRPFSLHNLSNEQTSRHSPASNHNVQRMFALRKINRTMNGYRHDKSARGSSRGSSLLPVPSLPPEVTAILKTGSRRNTMRQPSDFTRIAPTLNAAVIGEPQTSGSGYSRCPPPPEPDSPQDVTSNIEPVNLDQSDDDVELSAPPIRSDVNMDAEAVAADVSRGSLEMNAEAAADVSVATDDQDLQALGDLARNEEPDAIGSAATEKPQSQSKKDAGKRKRDTDDEPSEPITVKEFNLNLLRLLECPVCLEWMEPPMSQCRRGHLVCGRCRARLAACPVCRTAFSSVRNRAMEGVAEMVRYPCRHSCGREVRLRARGPHESSCAARRYRCPAPACAPRAPLPHAALAHHLQNKHPLMVRMGWKQKFWMKLNEELHENWVIMALHQLFHLRIDVDIRTWGLVVYVAYIGPKCKASNYTYGVTIVGQHSSRRISYRRATHCDLESPSLNVGRQDCFHLTLEQALNFLRDCTPHGDHDKHLFIDIEIATADADDAEEPVS